MPSDAATVDGLPDRLGSAWRQSTATSSGSVSNRNYDAFGLTLSTMGSPLGPFGFAGTSGYQEDADSGLKLLGHRYYDASTGRFLSRDPAKDGRNWYGYCDGNPLGRVDPTGNAAIALGLLLVPGLGEAFAVVVIVGGVAYIGANIYDRVRKNNEEREQIEKEMDRQQLPRQHYPKVRDRIHQEKGGQETNPDKDQDLDLGDEIAKIIETIKKEIEDSLKKGRGGPRPRPPRGGGGHPGGGGYYG